MKQSYGKPSVVRAVDTNILVRFLTVDDPKQAQTARQIMEAGDIFIGVTVLLETEWVLRAGYGFSRDLIAVGLRGIGGLSGITIEEPAAVAHALDWMIEGMDFADALHLARSGHCDAFLTFDKKLARRTKGHASITIQTP
jgi:predicted nucleic-acid-binding protein